MFTQLISILVKSQTFSALMLLLALVVFAPEGYAQTATLTLVKTVTGGTLNQTDFLSFVNGVPQAWDVATVHTANVVLTASETPHADYTAGDWGGDCAVDGSITLALGEDKTCTITNTFVTASTGTLTLVKVVVGGTAVNTDWTLSATGPTPISGATGFASVTGAVVDAGDYTLDETGPVGYSDNAWDCGAASLTGDVVTVAVDATVTCTITNTFVPVSTGTLTLDKTSDVATYSAVDDVINYSYLVTSSGTGPVVGPITVADDKVTVTCPDVNTVGNNDANLDQGEEITCTASHSVGLADIDAGSITNTATASGGGVAATESAEDMVTVNYLAPPVPGLTLDKTSDVATYSAVDDVINYSYLVTSSGTGPVVGPITVADDREPVSCPPLNTVGNNDDNLDPGESLTCTASHSVVQADIDASSITNKATASGDAGATVSNEDMLTVNYQFIFNDGFESQ